MMKYQLDKVDIEYVLRDSAVSISSYVYTLTPTQEKLYLAIYASILLEEIEMTEQEVIEEAKSAIFNYYDPQELYFMGYLTPNRRFDDEDQRNFDNCKFNKIYLAKYDWSTYKLLSYFVENDIFGFVYLDGKNIFFDRAKTMNEGIAEIVEERAKVIFLKQSLDENLPTHENEAKKIIKI
ncbi:TPA: hypothetical protein ACU95S_007216 [Burkholderia cenocepacia]